MDYEGFEFESKSLFYSAIEDAIIDYYNLGYPESSEMPIQFNEGNKKIAITASEGSISCNVSIYKLTDSDKYTVSVSNVSVVKKRRRRK